MRRILLATSAILFVATAPAVAQDTMRAWRLVPEGQEVMSGDCVVAESGTEQFRPSGQDTPAQTGAPGECPPGMLPADDVVTESTSDSNSRDDNEDDTSTDSSDGGGASSGDDSSDNAE